MFCQVIKQAEGLHVGDPIDFSVPCGALGNVTAGLLAKKMGLPVRQIVSGTNDNDIFHRVRARIMEYARACVHVLVERRCLPGCLRTTKGPPVGQIVDGID